jgi:hypothetical protein
MSKAQDDNMRMQTTLGDSTGARIMSSKIQLTSLFLKMQVILDKSGEENLEDMEIQVHNMQGSLIAASQKVINKLQSVNKGFEEHVAE